MMFHCCTPPDSVLATPGPTLPLGFGQGLHPEFPTSPQHPQPGLSLDCLSRKRRSPGSGPSGPPVLAASNPLAWEGC